MNNEVGSVCIDDEYLPRRSWYFKDLFGRRPDTRVVEQQERTFNDHFYRPAWRLTGDVYEDYLNFYTPRGMGLLGIGVGLHAILANTTLDQQFRDSFQDNAVGEPDAWMAGRYLGETYIMVPGILAIWGIDEFLDRRYPQRNAWACNVGDWARQSMRSYVVGAPVTGVLQVLIGASRPGETSANSHWKPFDDNNGVSGHAFVGAVPFLVAARQTDNCLLKSAFFAGSGVAAYSRVYDDKHYLSQALLGWWIAYLAVDATQLTEESSIEYRLVPLSLDGQVALGIEFRY